MRLREQYKHLLNYGANLITLLVEGFCFGYIWYSVTRSSLVSGAVETGRSSDCMCW